MLCSVMRMIFLCNHQNNDDRCVVAEADASKGAATNVPKSREVLDGLMAAPRGVESDRTSGMVIHRTTSTKLRSLLS